VTVADNLALLERACLAARRFDTRLVRVFTFFRVPWDEAVVAKVARHIARAAEVARRHDVVLAVENEPVCVVATGAELGRFFERLDALLPAELRPHVGALWDPGNALAAGEPAPFPDGYAAVPVRASCTSTSRTSAARPPPSAPSCRSARAASTTAASSAPCGATATAAARCSSRTTPRRGSTRTTP
jgi:hypothetical protein